MNILISGGTGMVGTALTDTLVKAGHRVTILTRNPASAQKNKGWGDQVDYAAWDIKKQTIEETAVAKADAIVHLAGAGVVAEPWTEAYKKEILDSRVNSSKLLMDAIARNKGSVKTFVSASAIGWYGADGTDGRAPFTEDAPYAPGFLGDTCHLWEESVKPVTQMGVRLVICRIGIVLSMEGGALPEFNKPLQFRVAGVLGHGRQVVSWVHIQDLCNVFRFAIENEALHGIYNAVAPNPVTNRELTLALAQLRFGKAFIAMPVPAFVLKMMMGERSVEVLKSTTVSAEKIRAAGFEFTWPEIKMALSQLISD